MRANIGLEDIQWSARSTMRLLNVTLVVVLLSATVVFAQNQSAQISGLVTDPGGSVVPKAAIEVFNKDNSSVRNTQSNNDGYYIAPLLQPGNYRIRVTAQGFDTIVRDGVALVAAQNARIDFSLKVGATTEAVSVAGDAAQINQESPQLQANIPPITLQELPLIVSGGPRNMGSLVTLIPGVTSPSNTVTTAHMNGGLSYEQETILDGISIVYTDGGNGLFNLTTDFPQSPDMISEVSVLTSNYAPQYGNSAASSLIMETKSGTDTFHGTAFEYLRNTVLDAAPYGAAGVRPPDIENDFGYAISGPVKIPKLRSARSKPFFFLAWEGYRAAGQAIRPVISIPSIQERAGDFRDWKDQNGNLIPIFDPATTQIVNGQVVRQQFMGCNGTTPNVICPSDPRLQNSLALQWFKFLPTPTSPGPLNNYTPPHPPASIYANRGTYDTRVDEYFGDKDHFSGSLYVGYDVPDLQTLLPAPISTEGSCTSWGCVNSLIRLNWDHTLSPTLLNHVAYGLTRAANVPGYYPNQKYADQFPKLPGLPYPQYTPSIAFSDGFQSYGGSNGGDNFSNVNIWNDLVTWSHGAHVFAFGGEYRRIGLNECGGGTPGGQFSFASGETGIASELSGSPIASFLLGQVDSTTATVYGFGGCYYPRQSVLALHAGDTWKLTPKLSLSYGVRWDLHTPSEEKYNHMSFFDPVGLNPDAGNLPGRLAFAGDRYGPASFGNRYPENIVHDLFAPRLGFAYSLNSKTVVRGGYGIFYSDAKYPGWNMGVGTAGFDANPFFSSTLGGLQPAAILSQGFPQNYTHPPFINSGFLNGQTGPLYRPFDSNHLPYSEQWDLVIERQVTKDFSVSAAYTGNRGVHLYSDQDSPNALNPSLLSMGSKLNDQFGPTDVSVDGVPAPYPGWAQQMTGCAPSVAQALLPFPQYCGGMSAVNENKGSSSYNSFQLRAEKRTTANSFVLVSYTFSKLLTTVDSTQPSNEVGVTSAVFSPHQQQRNWSLAAGDTPNTLAVTFVYHLPFGNGQRWLSNSHGFVNSLLGGWESSGVFHASSAPPFIFRSSACNVPAQFVASCVPGILPGANPFAQSESQFNPSKPLFNIDAFQNPSNTNNFSFYLGDGSRVSNLRGFPYYNQDFALMKNISITERLKFQLRAEFFNLWNWHIFQAQGNSFSENTSAFSTDVGSPSFGLWNGSVTAPRTIQLAGRVTF